jgi:2-polyprenyl-3-methyl-5-hydroxy-6-metoxy-1,4-benzoquinol methylase
MKVTKLVYEAINRPVLSRVPLAAKRILDLGCGSGALGYEIKTAHPCHVTGVTFSKEEAAIACKRLDEVRTQDLNAFSADGFDSFDCVICSHVLEHLHDPESVLREIHKLLRPDGVLIIALPNVLFWKQRLQFLRGRFRYTEGGLMDRTHARFFDWESANNMLRNAGFAILESAADGNLPLSRFLLRPGRWLSKASVQHFPGLFGFQFIFVCRAKSKE